jgi:hypothetical protein
MDENFNSKMTFNSLISQVPVPENRDINPEVLDLLEYEADLVSILDFRKTPLTAFVYGCLGHQKMFEHLRIAKDYFAGHYSSERFLAQMDAHVVKSIAEVSAQMISTRKTQFLKIARSRQRKKSA